MENIFDANTFDKINSRIDQLSENSEALWGKMNVGQMLRHCQIAFEIALGKRDMETKVGFMKKLIFKLFKPIMYNDKLWKQNVKTGKEFIITGQKDFKLEKNNLINLINEFASKKNNSDWPEHPIFGRFTTEQRGKMQSKHLDHHLRQFGV